MMDRRRFLAAVALLVSFRSSIARGDFLGLGKVRKAIGRGIKKLGRWMESAAKSAVDFLKNPEKELRRIMIKAAMRAAPSSFYFSRPHFIRIGDEDYPNTDPVYLINGVKTNRVDAEMNAKVLSAVLKRRVYAIHNTTASDKQRVLWGIAGVSAGGASMAAAAAKWFPDGFQCAVDAMWTPPLPQFSQTARQVGQLIKDAREPISIVTHSQGCMQVLNAAICVAAYGYENRLSRVRWVATGFNVRNFPGFGSTESELDKFTDICLASDPIVILSSGSLMFGTIGAAFARVDQFSIDDHEFAPVNGNTSDVRRGYASMVKDFMLWPSQAKHARMFPVRLVEIQNLTGHVATARFQTLILVNRPPSGPIQSNPNPRRKEKSPLPVVNPNQQIDVSPVITQRIAPYSVAMLVTPDDKAVRAARIALSIEIGGEVTIYGTPNKPLVVSDSYFADAIDTFQLELENEDSVTQTYTTPFATTVCHGKETLWMGIDNQWAFTYNEGGEAGMYQSAPHPANTRYASSHYCYRNMLEPDGGLVMVPRSGAGNVVRILPDGQEIADCLIEPFDPDGWPSNWKPVDDGGPAEQPPQETPTNQLPQNSGGSAGYILGAIVFDYPHGAIITKVEPGGPADRSGLRIGDVITSVNGDRVGSYKQALQVFRKYQGHTVDVQILDIRTGNVNLPVGATRLGIRLMDDNVTVDDVVPDSICRHMVDDAGQHIELRSGDKLTAVAGVAIGGQVDVSSLLRNNAGKRVPLRFTRPGTETPVRKLTLNRAE